MNNAFWGEPISIYTDADALSDGILTDVSPYGVTFNGKPINRITIGAALALDIEEKQSCTISNHLKFISENSKPDAGWGIFAPDERLSNERFWLVDNELEGFTLMLPEEY